MITPLLVRIGALRSSSSDEEIVEIIQVIRGSYPADPAIAAALAQALAESGDKIRVAGDLVADVASTGGPSSLSTLLSPLYLRLAGAIVPKLGLAGRPAGGIDCVAQIPGYRTTLSRAELETILAKAGFAHFLGAPHFAPLDYRMFRMRQALGAQAVPTLVVASILAKKIAVGVKFAGLDIRVATHGNFGVTWEAARANAHLFLNAALILGVRAAPVLTYAQTPCQPYLGRRESLVALADLFTNRASPWLERHHVLCRRLAMVTVPQAMLRAFADSDLREVRSIFTENLTSQGATNAGFEDSVAETRAAHISDVRASNSGFCSYPLGPLREAIVAWQKSYETAVQEFPDPVGIVFLHEPGAWVEEGEAVATVRCPSELRSAVLPTVASIIGTPSRVPKGQGFEVVHD
jgi:thymidine phosphorylase